ncbi:MAG TPA: RsmD family RNA methyltransferase [Pirellulales bacterium]
MPKKSPGQKPIPYKPKSKTDVDAESAVGLRIVGGKHGGRRLIYHGDKRVRPMKDRVREAVFNLLGVDPVGRQAIDLFGGTGALGLEAVSRGAVRALFVERHFPTANFLRDNIRSLEEEGRCRIETGDTFWWWNNARKIEGDEPWLTFVSPPYNLFHDNRQPLMDLIASVLELSPIGSVCVAEADVGFNVNLLPRAAEWETRDYPPARVSIHRKNA